MNSDNSKEIPLVKFGNVCKFQGGNGFKEEIQGLKSGDFPFIKVSDMEILSNKKYILDANNWIDQKTSIKESIKLFPKNSVVFAKVGAALLLNRRRILTRDTAIDNNMMAAIPENIEFEFLFYLLSNIDFSNFVQSGAVPSVNQTQLSSIEILLPCSNEQEKIAEVLSTIDRAIAQTEAIIAKQQRIKMGLMQDLLTKGIDENGNIRSEATHEFKDSAIGRIPVEWEVKGLREISLIIDPNPSHRYPPSSGIGVLIASTENFIGDNEFDLSFLEKVPFYVFDQQNQRCCFSKTDVVFARKGRLGFARYYGESKKVFSHTVVIFKPYDRSQLDPHYLLWIVRFRDFFEQIDKQMNSNSGVPTLGVKFLGAVPVRVPKLSEQVQICLTLDSLEKRIEEEKSNLSKQKRHKAVLMQDLLTGKVRVTNLLNQKAAAN